ncbi:MAG TPA: hypothetical protein VGP33_11685, partial [Chloroflexota bacterium]|nr:hypothetical protein [Chloroflexota bacterium]
MSLARVPHRMLSRRSVLRAATSATMLSAGAALLAACGGSAAVTAASSSVATAANVATTSQAAATSAPAASSAAVQGNGATIEFWLVDQNTNTQKLYKDTVLPAIKQALPNVTVNMGWKDWGSTNTGVDQSLSAAFAGGVGPDIFQWGAEYAFRVAHLKMGLVIDKMIDQWGQRNDFFPSALQTCQWQGKTYGLPYLSSPRTYFSRGDILKANGISDAPVTWEDDLDDGKKLTKIAAGALTQLGTNTGADWQEFTELLISVGGGLLVNGKTALNSPEGQLVAQFMQ